MSNRRLASVRRWVRRGFIVWAVVSTAWLLNSYRTRGVASVVLASDASVAVQSSDETLVFAPTSGIRRSGLIFIVGAGVSAEAYGPLLRPLAEQGYRVVVVRLPLRIAPFERNKVAALARVRAAVVGRDDVERWVVAGHSLGGALASRIAADVPETVAAIVLVGTSHPKTIDLSHASIPITKVYASNDGVATVAMIDRTRALLPSDTRWVHVEGGNHSQFAHYGRQLFDGSPTITREQQQDLTRAALLDALERASDDDRPRDSQRRRPLSLRARFAAGG